MNVPVEWAVHVRWLPWAPPWRRVWRAWLSNAAVLLELARSVEAFAPNFLSLMVGVAASFCLVFGAAVLALADALATGVALAASACGHLVLRRPLLVVAENANGQWKGWWVAGWRRARRARDVIAAQLAESGPDSCSRQPIPGMVGEFGSPRLHG